MAGFLVVFWAVPVMTLGHVLLAALVTGYILAGIRFEEWDTRRDLGENYPAYAARAPHSSRAGPGRPPGGADRGWRASGTGHVDARRPNNFSRDVRPE